ncbi:hypothetical protein F2P81_009146 [Scophthalmus maximus]|uniref:Uncharacterized protein n=1 Tax=Scophthalmus maximus TaxID=52904 RepID=A0A6A4T929_SCOMX|nr:hypothetical protein F2P81_009146 [Scophthalmus maximus]
MRAPVQTEPALLCGFLLRKTSTTARCFRRSEAQPKERKRGISRRRFCRSRIRSRGGSGTRPRFAARFSPEADALDHVDDRLRMFISAFEYEKNWKRETIGGAVCSEQEIVTVHHVDQAPDSILCFSQKAALIREINIVPLEVILGQQSNSDIRERNEAQRRHTADERSCLMSECLAHRLPSVTWRRCIIGEGSEKLEEKSETDALLKVIALRVHVLSEDTRRSSFQNRALTFFFFFSFAHRLPSVTWRRCIIGEGSEKLEEKSETDALLKVIALRVHVLSEDTRRSSFQNRALTVCELLSQRHM